MSDIPLFRFAAESVVAAALVVAAIKTLLRPFFDSMVYAALARDTARLKAFAEVDKMKEHLERVGQLVEAQKDSQDFFRTSLDRLGAHVNTLPQINLAIEASASAMSGVTVTLGEMRGELASQGKAIAKIEGFLERGWNGQERRKNRASA